MKVNEPTVLPYHFPPHFFRHCLSVTISILVCVLLDFLTIEYLKPRIAKPKAGLVVRWQGGEVETNPVALRMPEMTNNVLLGFGSDGKVYFKIK